ncbi:TPA: ATP-binding protein [Candidatus Bipolaricaulota bacterium]|nr:ATP-binding protein [Candidatus Bipolaricaulota bacterium]
MEFEAKLNEAERSLERGAAAQAALAGGQMLEALLRSVYRELMPKLPPQQAAKAAAALEKVGKGKGVEGLTLGQLLGLFRTGGLFSLAERHLNQDLSLLTNDQLVNGWVELRNRAAHGVTGLDEEEIHVFLVNLRQLLRQAGYLETAEGIGGELPPWWEVARPHRDVWEGKLSLDKFAAKLDEVVLGRGPDEYREPRQFFDRTYPTQGLVILLATVLRRLAGQGGEGIVHLQTPFGGGKTHCLIALYHFFKHPEIALETQFGDWVISEAGVEVPKGVRVLTFVGVSEDPLTGKTPWGKLAEQLGRYEDLRDSDESRLTPGKERLRKLLAGAPTLILMDEIAEYAAKVVSPKEIAEAGENAARVYQSQLFSFFHDLTEAVSSLPNCALVVTLTTSSPYGAEGERAQHQLGEIFGRMRKILEPVQGEEIYEIVRRRLFEDLGAEQQRRRIAAAIWRAYRDLGDQVPPSVRSADYRDKLVRAYPFHPELVDVLHERWGSFSGFQRTRGVLRFLAEVVAWHWNKRLPLFTLRSADVPLGVGGIRQELLEQIGREYESIIASDIAGGTALARRVDAKAQAEVKRYQLGSRLATAVFMYSFTGAEKEERGVSPAWLRTVVYEPGMPPTLIGDTLQKLESELLYLHKRDGRYFFSTEPNLNNLVVKAEEEIGPEEIEAELKKWVDKHSGMELKVKSWPRRPEEVPDRREPQLILLAPTLAYGAPQTEGFVRAVYDRAGEGKRKYPNAVLVLAPDPNDLERARLAVKQLLALRTVKSSHWERLDELDQNELGKRIQTVEQSVEDRVLGCWRHLSWLEAGGLRWADLGTPHLGPARSLCGRAVEYLKDSDRWIEDIAPQKIIQLAFASGEKEKPYREVRDVFYCVPGRPIAPERALRKAVREGVREGVLGIRFGGRLTFKREVPDSLLDPEALIVRGEVAEAELAQAEAPKEEQRGIGQQEGRPTPPEVPPAVAQKLRLRLRIPWDRLADIQRGVILPLRGKSKRLELEITIEAEAEEGFSQDVLERKVRETLKQLGIKWSEDIS